MADNITQFESVGGFSGANLFVSGATFTGNVAMTSTSSHTGLASFAGGITASGATFMGNINLQNAESIRNTTNGRIDFMPGPVSGTTYGLYMDFTGLVSGQYGPQFGTITSSTGTLDQASIFYASDLVLNNAKLFSFGSAQRYTFAMKTSTNSTLQLGVPAGIANESAAVSIIDYAWMGNGNRIPGTAHTHPNLYIYAAGAANANDFIRIEHDRTNANIVTGQTSGILLQPGSGWLGVSGGISASGGITFTGQVTVNTFKANTVGGDEGGQIDFGLAATNTSLTGGVAIDVYQNKVRIFETSGTNRGAFIDLTGAGTGVNSDLLTRVTVAPPGFTSAINTFNDSTDNGSKTIYYLSPMYKAYANYGSYTVKANRTYFTLFSTNKPVTIKTIRSVTNSTVTTGNCYLSVYSADSTTGLPKTILYSSASLAVGSGYGGASVTNASGLVTVPAGHFYLAATYSSTPIVFGYYRYTVDGVFGSSSYSAGPFNMMPIADYTGFTAGSLPAAGVTLSYLENSAGNYLGPVIDFAVV